MNPINLIRSVVNEVRYIRLPAMADSSKRTDICVERLPDAGLFLESDDPSFVQHTIRPPSTAELIKSDVAAACRKLFRMSPAEALNALPGLFDVLQRSSSENAKRLLDCPPEGNTRHEFDKKVAANACTWIFSKNRAAVESFVAEHYGQCGESSRQVLIKGCEGAKIFPTALVPEILEELRSFMLRTSDTTIDPLSRISFFTTGGSKLSFACLGIVRILEDVGIAKQAEPGGAQKKSNGISLDEILLQGAFKVTIPDCPEERSSILSMLVNNKITEVRRLIVPLLSDFRDAQPRSLPVLIQLLKDSDGRVVGGSIEAISKLGPSAQEARNELFRLVHEDTCACAALKALVMLGVRTPAVESLLEERWKVLASWFDSDQNTKNPAPRMPVNRSDDWDEDFVELSQVIKGAHDQGQRQQALNAMKDLQDFLRAVVKLSGYSKRAEYLLSEIGSHPSTFISKSLDEARAGD